MKPTAYMKKEVLDTLHPLDCFYAFASPGKGIREPLFTWEQVKKMLINSNESYFDAMDYVGEVQGVIDQELSK